MNERTRNRIVGSLILISVAAIFLPMLLDGAGIEQRAVPTMPEGRTPTRSEVATIDPDSKDWAFVQEADARREAPESRTVDGRAVHADAEPPPAKDAELVTSLAADGTPLAFSVQLATFADEANAIALRDRLQGDGFEAYLARSEDDDGKVLYRVAVGPRLDRAAVERLRDDLARRYDLDGLVVRFTLGQTTGTP